jgi:histidinol-phosphate/aromatic aminotransferase/cobyric acid decarboxylase-like protein
MASSKVFPSFNFVGPAQGDLSPKRSHVHGRCGVVTRYRGSEILRQCIRVAVKTDENANSWSWPRALGRIA